MTSLVILTVNFPYEGGEQFIESEISYWDSTKFEKVLIYPSNRQGLKRLYPKSISILNGLSPNVSKLEKLYFASLGFFSRIFGKNSNTFFLQRKLILLTYIML